MKLNGPLRVGIIGAGWIAEKAAITLNGLADCECYAIASRSIDKAEAFCKKKMENDKSLWLIFRTHC